MSDADNIVCCRDLLLNETVVNNHIFSATATKLRKYKGCHDNACENGRPPSSIVVPFAVDSLGNFCSVAVIFLKKLAKTKFAKIPGSKEFQDLTASTWVNTTEKREEKREEKETETTDHKQVQGTDQQSVTIIA